MTVRPHTACRACQGTRLETYLDLGGQPLANAFVRRDQLTQPEFRAPLKVARCLDCGLSQLEHVVDPDVLFRDYAYVSGHAAGWKQHCENLVDDIIAAGGKSPHFPLVCDIACNDGTFLQACQERGIPAFGVEPALNLRSGPVPVVKEFWSSELAARLLRYPGQPDVIVAQNVIGHVDDVQDFMIGLAIALKPGGMIILECPHIQPLMEAGAFDTIYHEHLSYWSLGPIMRVAGQANLRVADVQCFPKLHGGTFRYTLRHAEATVETPDSVRQVLRWEQRTLTGTEYRVFGETVRWGLHRLAGILKEGSQLDTYAFGASAKSTVLLNALQQMTGIEPGLYLHAIFDDTPAKQGKFTPGLHLSVLPVPDDFSPIKTLLLTAPNWADALKRKALDRGFHGRFVIPWRGVEVEVSKNVTVP